MSGDEHSLEYIRDYYGVPANKGQRVRFKGKLGTIVGGNGPHLKVLLDEEKHTGIYHPTWELEYLDECLENYPEGVK